MSLQVRKGQFSTYLKPILILIFGVLLIMVVNSLLNFQTSLSRQEADITFQSAGLDNIERVTSCLGVNEYGGQSRYLLNQSKIKRFEQQYPLREPPCAEDFRYGYEVEIEQEFMQGIQENPDPAAIQVAFVLDNTGSMGSDIDAVKNNIRTFIDNLGNSEAGIVTFKDSPSFEIDFTNSKSDLESELGSISAGGGDDAQEDVSGGIRTALDDLSWDSDKIKAMVIANNAGAHDCDRLEDLASEAAAENIIIYTVFDGSHCSSELTSTLPDTTGGQHFSLGESWAGILGEIAGDIGSTQAVGGDTTCSLPPVTKYNGTADLVFVADTSASYDSEWSVICDAVDDTLSEMENKGLDTNISIYGLAPDADDVGDGNYSGNDQGYPMDMQGSAGSGSYNYMPGSRNVPTCVADNDNVAVSSGYGKGITDWNGTALRSYDADHDLGLEAWGVGAKWIFENHEWRQDTDRRMMFIFGDSFPSGGGDPSHFQPESNYNTPDVIDSDEDIVNNVTAYANDKNVQLFTFVGDSWDGNANDHTSYGDPSMGDAEELMRMAAEDTGGEYMQYDDASNLPSRIRELFKSVETSADQTCDPLTYSFGQQGNRDGAGQSQQSTLQFPISVWHSQEVRTPGTLRLTQRAGELERLAGILRQVYREGNKSGENTRQTVRFSNNNQIDGIPDYAYETNATSTYHLTNASTPSNDVKIRDDLIVGVDGHQQFHIKQATSPIDLSQDQYKFTSYRGRTLQVIAVNRDDSTGMHLDQLALTCPGCSQNQTITPSIHLSESDDAYSDKGGIGVFQHNFTTITVGNTTTATDSAVCIQDDNCITLGADLQSFTLEPGSHILSVSYNATTAEVRLSD